MWFTTVECERNGQVETRIKSCSPSEDSLIVVDSLPLLMPIWDRQYLWDFTVDLRPLGPIGVLASVSALRVLSS